MVPVQHRLLALIFRQRIRIFGNDRVIFAGRHIGKAVARRRCRIDEFLHARGAGTFQHLDSALHVRRHILDRLFDGRHDVADTSIVDHVLDAFKQRVAGLVLTDIGFDQFNIRVRGMLFEIGLATTDQIVDHPDPKAVIDQVIHHVAADKTGTPGDHDHACLLQSSRNL